ncbi:hypothetical protein KKA93_00705 [Patescibacteria group bacterium]|nr:hypothetical protein [Patescibacteria group bacterium]MBU1663233.1 hypothetical protein [Patescibacteria group bacterium]MBU1934364.1 hypothetical protein [Patescibacteria group bacterium]MBU2008066.1 hypothetical protein [Patescibacteria group bacterium]MBU2233887.1 hypothetical protein [Patescibacteria group bacterium]
MTIESEKSILGDSNSDPELKEKVKILGGSLNPAETISSPTVQELAKKESEEFPGLSEEIRWSRLSRQIILTKRYII